MKYALIVSLLLATSAMAQEQAAIPPAPPNPNDLVVSITLNAQERIAMEQLCKAAEYANHMNFDEVCNYFRRKLDAALVQEKSKKSAEATAAAKIAADGKPAKK